MRLFQLSIYLFILIYSVQGQNKINYGSNHGKYITIQNIKIYYEEYGKGTPLILLHGGLESIHDFQAVIPVLSKQYRVIAFDRPCHGRSEHIDSLSYHVMAEYTSSFIDHLKLDTTYLMGWSDGGNTALLVASMRPDKIKKVIICGADMNDGQEGSQPPENLLRITPSFVENNWQGWLINYKSISPQPNNWKTFITNTVKMWLQIDYISKKEMQELKCKTLLVLGDRDIVKPEVGIKMNRLIKNSQLCILPNTTHFLLAEKPDLVSRLAIDFLKE
jgi:pimeloyl-ACP methyl ester carboxylesterase